MNSPLRLTVVRSILLLIFIFFASACSAQIQKTTEIESALFFGKNRFIPMGKNGILIFSEEVRPENKADRILNFSMLDTGFSKVWTKQQVVDARMAIFKSDLDGENYYLLLTDVTRKHRYAIIRVNINNGSIAVTNGQIPDKFIVEDFTASGEDAFLIGIHNFNFGRLCINAFSCGLLARKNQTSAMLLHSDLQLQRDSAIIVRKEGSGMLAIAKSPDRKSISTLYYSSPTENVYDTYVCEYEMNGTKKSEIKLDPGDNNLIDGHITYLNNQERIYAGSYAQGHPGKEKSVSVFADGFYFAKTDGGQQVFINYFLFSELKSFWKYVETSFSRRTTKKMKKKAARRKEEGTGLDLNYMLSLHDIIEWNGQYIQIAEVYHLVYRTETYPSVNTNGTVSYTTRQVFDGFKYTHAIVCCIDKNGHLKWDATVELKNVHSYDLEEHITAQPKDNGILLSYANKGSLYSLVISEGNASDMPKMTEVMVAKSNESEDADAIDGLNYWYGNYYVIWYFYSTVKPGTEQFGRKAKMTPVLKIKKVCFLG